MSVPFNPLAIRLLPRQYKAFMNNAQAITKMNPKDLKFFIELLVGTAEDAYFGALWKLSDKALSALATEHRVAISPRARARLVALARCINLATPVVQDANGKLSFPYTLQEDEIHMAKPNDAWSPDPDDPFADEIIVPQPDPTVFGINPYLAMLCGKEMKVHHHAGSRLPIMHQHIVKKYGPTHEMWNRAGATNMALVVGVLLHHSDFKDLTRGNPRAALGAVKDPANVHIYDQTTCTRIVKAAETFWRDCYNGYIAIMVQMRAKLSVTQTAAPQHNTPQPRPEPKMRYSGADVQALEALLCKTLDSSEVRRVLRYIPGGGEMVRALPGRNASDLATCEAVTKQVVKNGMLPEFFSAWSKERPRRNNQIVPLAQRFDLQVVETHHDKSFPYHTFGK